MKKRLLSLFLLGAFVLGACNSPTTDGGSGEPSGGDPIEPPPVEVDEDDLWVEPNADDGTDHNLLPKSGEKYETYMSNVPTVLEKIPTITVKLSADETTCVVPKMENTYLTTGNKNDKGPYYACTIDMFNEEIEYLKDVECQIKVRGNYTSNYRKKPYRLKFASKVAMPGFSTKFKNWVLLADVKDHSHLRNLLSFHLGDVLFNTYDDYSSHYQPVELNFVDGTGQTRYWGTYLLCEQQEIKGDRIDITDVGDLKGEDGKKGSYNGTDIGYLMEYDGYFIEERGSTSWFNFDDNSFKFSIDDGSKTDGDATFTIPYNNRARFNLLNGSTGLPRVPGFTLKGDVSSDNPTNQLSFISHYMENVYLILYNATFNKRYYEFNADYSAISLNSSLTSEQAIAKAIDIDSLVNMYILQEMACDSDIAWSSFYMDVDFGTEAPDHLLRFEAPWDFDGAYGIKYGNANSGEGYFAATSDNPWLSIIMNNEWFVDKVKERYNELYSYDVLSDMLTLIDTLSDQYESSYVKDVTRWGSNDETGEVRQDWARLTTQKEHASVLKEWLKTRFNYFSKTWLNGYDVETHKKDISGNNISQGNIALKTNGTKYRYEAEDAVISANARVKTGDETASNNGYVGNLNNGGTLTFKVTATKRKQAYYTVRFAKPMNAGLFNDVYEIKVNDVKLPVRDINLPAMSQGNWHDWIEVDLYSSWLEEGENTIVITAKQGSSNFDYLDIYSKDTLA